MSGALCVMTPGEVVIPLWCVDSWDIPLKVSFLIKIDRSLKVVNIVCLCQQVQ